MCTIWTILLHAGASQVFLNGKPLELSNFNLYAVADQVRAEVRPMIHAAPRQRTYLCVCLG